MDGIRAASLKHAAEIAGLRGETAALRAENAALRKDLDASRHKGVWDVNREYEMHNQVTFDGSTWLALRGSRGVRPNAGDKSWVLITKRGRDGKDGKDAGRI
jgi:hypothetical protein